ncbi:MAG: hypothetical protein RIA69_04155 [Cyclobacteriaceae bacterium]
MNLQEKLNRINEEIEAGLKLKSADRLRNLINEYPNELSIWERLAELYYESGFLDAAGRYWILTEPTDERIKVAVDIYLNSVNHSGTQILQDITFRGNKDELPEYARNKLAEFEADSKMKSSYVPTFKPKQDKNKRKDSKHQETIRDKLTKWGIIAILISIIVFTLIGFGTTISWIF